MLKTREEANQAYIDVLQQAKKDKCVKSTMSELGRKDLFFLLSKILHRKDVDRDWLYDRCKEVYDNPDNHLDLWAREHYKSTIITFAKSIQDIINNPEITIGIFSHTKPIAKGFLAQIKQELEGNELLKELYPDVLYQNPRKESSRWSLETGITVKRKTNPKEATVEAHGLVDGQPTSKHFDVLNYDDVVTRESVTTSDQIKKVNEAYALSLNLGTDGGVRRVIGTRYHHRDTYQDMINKGSIIQRIYPATKNGEVDGEPVLISREALRQKYKDQGVYVFGCQMLQNPTADGAMGFKEEWLRQYDVRPYREGQKLWHTDWNYYLLCDPAGEKKADNDYTVMVVIGLAPDQNYYLCAGIRDRLNLTERTDKLIELHRQFPITKTGYEKYGKDSDIEHIKFVQEQQGYRFEIVQLGGAMPKNDRIRKLVPVFELGKFYIPYMMPFYDYQGGYIDFIKAFITEEYLPFPVALHDDMLDCIARIKDPGLNAKFPVKNPELRVQMDYAIGEEWSPHDYL